MNGQYAVRTEQYLLKLNKHSTWCQHSSIHATIHFVTVSQVILSWWKLRSQRWEKAIYTFPWINYDSLSKWVILWVSAISSFQQYYMQNIFAHICRKIKYSQVQAKTVNNILPAVLKLTISVAVVVAFSLLSRILGGSKEKTKNKQTVLCDSDMKFALNQGQC